VKNLFYNIPARRNFLKSNPVETRHIIDEFQRVALAHPNVFFTLHHDEQEVYHLPIAPLKQRIIHLLGNNYNERLVPVDEETSIIQVKGFIGKPAFAKKTRGDQFFFVNNRFIKDGYLNHAVMIAYEQLLPDDCFPLYVLFIEIDPAKIDINVHPTKTEIKYQDEKAIYAIIRSAVKRSLGKYNITPSLDFNQETAFDGLISSVPIEDLKAPSVNFNPDFNPFTEEKKADREIPYLRNLNDTRQGIPKNWETLYEINQQPTVLQSSFDMETEKKLQINNAGVDTLGSRMVFQLHQKYIITQIKNGLILVDQQAAHERVLYERFLKQLDQNKGASQQSLFPQTLTLSTTDFALANELLPYLHALGFQIRDFGKNTLVVEGVPADIPENNDLATMLEELIEGFKNNHTVLKLDKRDNLARTLAKNASIKAGTKLELAEMNDLVDQLFACEMPNAAVSGKQIIVKITLDELAERFNKR
jgi:DNA mismatch repair protein MutL